MNPIETAGSFYRELKKRGLHLRKNNGRDNELIENLAQSFDLKSSHLQRDLDKSNLSAEDFLVEFIELSAPFAKMFLEIWAYLSANFAPNAEESVSVRFGFKKSKNKQLIDFEQFRRYSEKSQIVLKASKVQIWPIEAIDHLFELGRLLTGKKADITTEYDKTGRYSPRSDSIYLLPKVDKTEHQFDKVVKSINELFQKIIDEYTNQKSKEHESIISVDALTDLNDTDYQTLCRSAFRLTDLLPTWYYVFSNLNKISPQLKDQALHIYNSKILPLLIEQRRVTEIKVREALDILDLPFWRHRWHTYEIWATITTLKTLSEYTPELIIKNGRLPIDGYSAGAIAKLKVDHHPRACVATQVQTPYASTTSKRKNIKPDLRICLDKPKDEQNTIAVVEFKQRSRMDAKQTIEMAEAYTFGCPKSDGLIILNYDKANVLGLPAKSSYIQSLQPLNTSALLTFQKQLNSILSKYPTLKPSQTVVLLDLSLSMESAYNSIQAIKGIQKLCSIKNISVFGFGSRLVKGKEWYSSGKVIADHSSTDLLSTLIEIKSSFNLPARLLIVSNEKYDTPVLLDDIAETFTCMPNEIDTFINWLKSS